MVHEVLRDNSLEKGKETKLYWILLKRKVKDQLVQKVEFDRPGERNPEQDCCF